MELWRDRDPGQWPTRDYGTVGSGVQWVLTQTLEETLMAGVGVKRKIADQNSNYSTKAGESLGS